MICFLQGPVLYVFHQVESCYLKPGPSEINVGISGSNFDLNYCSAFKKRDRSTHKLMLSEAVIIELGALTNNPPTSSQD